MREIGIATSFMTLVFLSFIILVVLSADNININYDYKEEYIGCKEEKKVLSKQIEQNIKDIECPSVTCKTGFGSFSAGLIFYFIGFVYFGFNWLQGNKLNKKEKELDDKIKNKKESKK